MPVPGPVARLARVPVSAGRASTRLLKRLAKLASVAAAATAIVVLLDVLLLGRSKPGAGS